MAQTNELHSGHAQVTLFTPQGTESRRVYCAGTPPNNSCYYPNVAWFCSECGDIWKRQVYTFEFPYRPLVAEKWKVYSSRCPACQPPAPSDPIDDLLKDI